MLDFVDHPTTAVYFVYNIFYVMVLYKIIRRLAYTKTMDEIMGPCIINDIRNVTKKFSTIFLIKQNSNLLFFSNIMQISCNANTDNWSRSLMETLRISYRNGLHNSLSQSVYVPITWICLHRLYMYCRVVLLSWSAFWAPCLWQKR